MPAAAQPEYEFNIEITTGISAPPIGIINKKPNISVIKPGGTIIHIGLTQPAGKFNFRKATRQEVTFIGTYCYTNKDFENTIKILADRKIGKLDWIEYRELKKGAEAFKQIHDGTCSSPKIVLLP